MKLLPTFLFLFISLSIWCQNNIEEEYKSFIPKGYTVFEKYYGDLNNDKQEDCILIIKGTNKNKYSKNQYDKIVDRNRRGIIILFKKMDSYKVVSENYNCFSSENEDGGIYFPPELWIIVEKGNLIIHYGHGRYGFWRYIFKYDNSKFNLIEYISFYNRGPATLTETNINFLTKKKIKRENTFKKDDNGNEVFNDTLKYIEVKKLLNLSEIEDFDELHFNEY